MAENKREIVVPGEVLKTGEEFLPGDGTERIEKDIIAMQHDIAKVKAEVDAVVIFIHWGICFIPKTLATYQPPVAHAFIDAGADLILGHHAHTPKAVEVYKGKVCFYSIGNFMTTGSHEKRSPVRWDFLWYKLDPDSLYCFPIHCKQIILPKVVFSKRGVERVAFMPAYINKLAQPEVLDSNDSRFHEVVQTMEWVSDYMPHKFRIDGNEVIVES